jgi:cellulose synthase/poly-beta-1,6-N-acetylglucosamine synthase-like glycosyltransferase
VSVLGILLVSAAIFYSGLLAAYAIGLRRILDRQAFHPGSTDPITISVVIAARNEEDRIAACLESVMQCRDSVMEIIVIDDHSVDGTAAIVNQYRSTDDGVPVRLIQLADVDPSAAGKPAAIRAGIEAASAKVILSTDADCVVDPAWAREMARSFEPGVQFVSGPVRFAPLERWTDRIQALEFAGLIGIGAGAIGVGWPNMCNSANIAYLRSTALTRTQPDTGGVAADEIMLQELFRDDPNSVRFCGSRNAIVSTRPADTFRRFIEQRRRWAGTGARYPSVPLVAAIGAVYIFYVLLVWTAIVVFSGVTSLLPQLVLAILLKVAAEAWLLGPALRTFADPALMRYFPPAQILQIPYVVLIGLAGVIGTTSWKGRTT